MKKEQIKNKINNIKDKVVANRGKIILCGSAIALTGLGCVCLKLKVKSNRLESINNDLKILTMANTLTQTHLHDRLDTIDNIVCNSGITEQATLTINNKINTLDRKIKCLKNSQGDPNKDFKISELQSGITEYNYILEDIEILKDLCKNRTEAEKLLD